MITAAIAGVLSSWVVPAGAAVDRAEVDALSAGVEPKVIAWRRDIHEHPEFSNRETRTAMHAMTQVVLAYLESKSLEAH